MILKILNNGTIHFRGYTGKMGEQPQGAKQMGFTDFHNWVSQEHHQAWHLSCWDSGLPDPLVRKGRGGRLPRTRAGRAVGSKMASRPCLTVFPGITTVDLGGGENDSRQR